MAQSSSPDFLAPWYLALENEWGYAFEVSGIDQVIVKLYKARQAADDPQLAALSLHRAPRNPNRELWIVKKDKKNAKPASIKQVLDGEGEGSVLDLGLEEPG